MKRFLGLMATILCVGAMVAQAEVKVADVFTDHMVLQRGQPVPIWGEAKPGESVSVRFRGQSKSAVADANGKWLVKLDPLMAGGPDKLTVSGGKTVEFEDVLVGEVWVGSGQSNMVIPGGNMRSSDPVLAKLLDGAPYNNIRYVSAHHPWQVANKKTVDEFSAILFSFGLRLHRELNVPVGLMWGAVNGTPSGFWLSEAALKADAPTQDLIRKANSNGQTTGGAVGCHYESFIRLFVRYGIRGVLWDQGESGTALAGVDSYTLMGALFRGWRHEWGQGDFPFVFVQKPSGGGCAFDYTNPVTKNGEPFVALPAEVPRDGYFLDPFLKMMTYSNVAMAISSDLGNGIHPNNKSGYGHRAADVALATVYGKKIEYYGPVYDSHKVEGDKVRINYKHVGQGLVSKNGTKLQGFALAGADNVYYWADAQIVGNSVVVSSPKVSHPVTVYYAWASVRTWANLFNKDGLPAVPFMVSGK